MIAVIKVHASVCMRFIIHVNAIIFSVLCVMPNIINVTVMYRPTVVLIERPFDIMASRQWKLL